VLKVLPKVLKVHKDSKELRVHKVPTLGHKEQQVQQVFKEHKVHKVRQPVLKVFRVFKELRVHKVPALEVRVI
jgi:hypothetical protein